jgi:biopolymer transport protein ExbD
VLIRAAESDADVSLDFVPMVDVLFNLLIFFLLATSIAQAEREVRIALPESRAAGPITAALRDIIINVDAGGRIIVAGRELSGDELDAAVREAVGRNPAQKVSVRGDRAVAYGQVARVLDICKGAGVSEPYLETLHAQ